MKLIILFLMIFIILLNQLAYSQHLRASRGDKRIRKNNSSHSRQQTSSPITTTIATTTVNIINTNKKDIDDESVDKNSNDHIGKYYGTYLGVFDTKVHEVSGEIFAVDESTIYIKNFKYDGQGPDAYFWGGINSFEPNENGFIIPDEKGSTKPLSKYFNQNLVLRLPEGKTLRDLTYIAVWCKKVGINFGHLDIRRVIKGSTIPTAIEIRPLSQLAHGVKSGPINVIDAQTFLITDFHYDGQGPAGYWWASKGDKPNAQGTHIPDENGSFKPLGRYGGETVVISLPENKTIYDYDFIGIWCAEFYVDFGNSRIPHNILVPPSPKMLGVKPEVVYGNLHLFQNTAPSFVPTDVTNSITTSSDNVAKNQLLNTIYRNNILLESGNKKENKFLSEEQLVKRRRKPPQRKTTNTLNINNNNSDNKNNFNDNNNDKNNNTLKKRDEFIFNENANENKNRNKYNRNKNQNGNKVVKNGEVEIKDLKKNEKKNRKTESKKTTISSYELINEPLIINDFDVFLLGSFGKRISKN